MTTQAEGATPEAAAPTTGATPETTTPASGATPEEVSPETTGATSESATPEIGATPEAAAPETGVTPEATPNLASLVWAKLSLGRFRDAVCSVSRFSRFPAGSDDYLNAFLDDPRPGKYCGRYVPGA